MGFFDAIADGLGLNKGKATTKAAQQNMGVIDDLETLGTGYLTDARGITSDYLDYGQTGANAYSDALGLNGAEGSAAAQERFTTSPGYDFALEQGLQGIQRLGASQGRMQSGNTDIDLLKYGVGAANDEWGRYLDRLGGYQNVYASGVAADTGSLNNLTDFGSSVASARMGANNQVAGGKEAGQGSWLDPLMAVGTLAGKSFGYGGFGGK